MNKNIQISTLKSQGEHTMNQQGILVVVSGFSGAGKGTLMKELLKRYDNYALSVSATTRQPREGEKDGEDYFFVNREYFQQMIEEGRLVEYAQYVNHYYGTPRDYVEKKMAEGKDVILEIEIQGALKVKKRFPDALLIFVTPPSAGELRRRLVGRGTETIEVINARLRRAAEEASGMEAYDYLLINDEIDKCVEQMHQLITLQHSKTCYHLDFLSSLKALGILEFFSVTGAIIAADAAAKAANVSLIEIRLGTGIGGKSFVTFTGDVGAVEESVEAGAKTAENSGALLEKVVIAHPDKELYRSLL